MSKDFSIFECSNPDCKFRFPVISIVSPRWCPKCKSKLLYIFSYKDESVNIQNSTKNNFSPQFSLVLDNIRSAYNVGSILRTLDGFVVRHIYFCGISPLPDNPKVSKTALGAENISNWSSHNNGLMLTKKLKHEGNCILGLEYCQKSIPITEVNKNVLNKPIVLIIGNELAGIDPDIRKVCDVLVHIPMYGKKSSFNVTVAFAIAAFYLNYIFHEKFIKSNLI